MKDTEIEIKVRIENKEPLAEFLKAHGEFKGNEHQIDEYFSPKEHDFLAVRPVKEWLRLRDADGTFSLNYKYWHHNDKGLSTHADEYETEVKDIATVKKILHSLRFRSIVVVDKIRTIWRYRDYEVAIDSVKSLGDFVEIEYKGEGNGLAPEAITDEMVNFLREIGCGKIEQHHVGYSFQLLFKEEVTSEVH